MRAGVVYRGCGLGAVRRCVFRISGEEIRAKWEATLGHCDYRGKRDC
jgi:hypothetical protein